MGVWIEIPNALKKRGKPSVTSYMGVWIEITGSELSGTDSNVTSYMGVWIEIKRQEQSKNIYWRHILYGCVD